MSSTATTIITDKVILPLKVSSRIADEFDSIQEQEGFGNRAATFVFLIKYYFQKKNDELSRAVEDFDRVLSGIDRKNIPSLKTQLGL
jgi:hypothetical protein